ncbi:MAG: 1-deoxy-D-xylulose-5-phosphate synthase, partial [Clostridiales bacterium]|nr:1-deoxy-D-xylulose-5-phosphate synthase [Clostridiales bacterium]
ISAALGFARARDILGEEQQVVAVIGDGALTGGMCYEALNDAGSSQTPMIIVLNDNEMSISKNVGAVAEHLTQLRASSGWNRTKAAVKSGLNRIPLLGKPLYKMMDWMKESVKGMVMDEGFFKALGFHYLGPINGHDIKTMEKVLKSAKKLKRPVLIHCVTKKGYGYEVAESHPDLFHGASPFSVENGELLFTNAAKSCGDIAAEELIALARRDSRITTITAAMPIGTGMDQFKKVFPLRSMDVGIAEGHAVTMAAGLAAGGLRPYVAIYSTFLQRGYDQLFHDIALQGLDVCFLLDRAGISGADGATHNGIYDFSYLRQLPGFLVLAPKDLHELRAMIRYSLHRKGPMAIRYPRELPEKVGMACNTFVPGRWTIEKNGQDGIILATGSMVGAALQTAKILEREGLGFMVVNASTVKPLDEQFLLEHGALPIITMEEHVLEGGFSSAIGEFCIGTQKPFPIKSFAITKEIPHGDRKSLVKLAGLDVENMTKEICSSMKKRKTA